MPQIKCPRCATTIEKPATGSPVCPNCGFGSTAAPVQPAFSSAPSGFVAQQKKGLGIASMIMGILSMCVGWIPFVGWAGLILAILGAVFGGIQLSNIKKNPAAYGGKGMAITGLVLSIIALALVLLFILVLASFLAALGGAAGAAASVAGAGGSFL